MGTIKKMVSANDFIKSTVGMIQALSLPEKEKRILTENLTKVFNAIGKRVGVLKLENVLLKKEKTLMRDVMEITAAQTKKREAEMEASRALMLDRPVRQVDLAEGLTDKLKISAEQAGKTNHFFNNPFLRGILLGVICSFSGYYLAVRYGFS